MPTEEVCYICGKKATRRERDVNKVKTGKCTCDSCYKLKHRYGTYEKHEKPKKCYNGENRCEFVEQYSTRCNVELSTKNVRRFEINGKSVYFCKKHGDRYYQRYNPNSQNNKRRTKSDKKDAE